MAFCGTMEEIVSKLRLPNEDEAITSGAIRERPHGKH